MDRVSAAHGLDAVEAHLASLEQNLALARAHGDNLELIDELEQIMKEIRGALSEPMSLPTSGKSRVSI